MGFALHPGTVFAEFGRFAGELIARFLIRVSVALRLNFFAVDGYEIHLVHAVTGRDGINRIGFRHTKLGSTRRAPVAHVDSTKLTIGRRGGDWSG